MRRIVIGAAFVVLAAAAGAAAQHHHHGAPAASAPASPPGSRRVTMDELHRGGGVPRGWKFTLPGGDAAKGRQVFADLECYKCHRVEGAGFPASGGDGKTGPELTRMGPHHPAEYFAESILSPNAIILEGPGYIGPDGKSIMPSYADSLSVAQLIDLVAFIKSQGEGGHAHQHGAGAAQERTVGPYHVRLMFHPSDGGHGGHAGHHAPNPGGAAGHLMVFVSDATSGEPVPYLPISAGVHIQGAPAQVVKLAPMIGRAGFHYGANATLPRGTQRIVLTIGATTMQVMGTDHARYAKPQTAAFDWSGAAK